MRRRRGGQRLDVGKLRDVGGHADGLVSLAGELGHCAVDGLFADIGDHDPHAGAGERPHHAEPDAARPPGHDGYPALELLHRVPLDKQTLVSERREGSVAVKKPVRTRRTAVARRS